MKREFKEDRKLDNKRISIKTKLVLSSFTMGDNKIKRTIIEYKSMSGYCLDAKNIREISISFRDIGKIELYINNSINPQWRIYSYLHNEKEDLIKLNKVLLKKKQSLLKLVNSIPV